MVERLEYLTPIQEGPGFDTRQSQKKLFSVYSMDVMINPPMTCQTLKETEALYHARKKLKTYWAGLFHRIGKKISISKKQHSISKFSEVGVCA